MSSTLVLGLGNPLMGDDGTGLSALHCLKHSYELSPDVVLVDGGTWGMNLLPVIESHRQVILLDAINTGARPGSVVSLTRDALPIYFQHKLSPHQIDLREVLALAEWRGTMPEFLLAMGIQPEVVEMGYGLSPAVEHAMPVLVAMVVRQLQKLGHSCRAREEQPRMRELVSA